ncbi:ABC transporter permease [Gudongella oleilytica]|jgi:lipoprotein-releasing system permease protein|uniref:ABC transporter permease n=1 Tax=Gudongella oleilytica TaxID=1582259 RepID=UPI000EE89488|nr:ABC transporter permease [Gudongella oleilytica]MDY0257696.1 ABC transporter permease [Gudongella oleilytica]HCO18779.1 ABC transporter permease [Tissierellales bacterium]
MKLSFSIALRFLRSGRGQTALIAIGIAVGVSVQIFIGLLIQGLQIDLVDTTIGSSSQITITSTNEEKLIKDWERTVYEAKLFEPEIINVSPAVDGPASIDYETDIDPVVIRGFNLSDSDPIYGFTDGLYEGSLPTQRDEAIIGRELAVKTGTKPGDRITLLTPDGGFTRLTVTGLFDLGVSSLNENWVVTTLDTAQGILGAGNSVTSVEMQVSEVFDADILAEKLEYSISGKDLRIDNWKDQNASLLSGLNGQSVSSYMIQVFVLVAVLLGISSVLAISVVQRSKQLGILKAMGILDSDASLIFVFQGLMLGLLGAVLGIALGFGLLWSFTKFALNPDGTPVLPIYINYGFIALSGSFAVISAMIASLIPARLSSRLNPIEVIKNG